MEMEERSMDQTEAALSIALATRSPPAYKEPLV